jgi:hypothetical protein
MSIGAASGGAAAPRYKPCCAPLVTVLPVYSVPFHRVSESAIDFENHAAMRADRMVLYEKAAFDMRGYRLPFVPFGIFLPRPRRGLKTQGNAENKRHVRDQK